MLLFGEDMDYLNTIKLKLSNRFKITDLGPVSHYLGMLIEYRNGRVSLNQTIYLQSILERFGMSDYKPSPTPMEPGIPNVIMPTDDA